MAKWFWETYLAVAAILLILGLTWILAATAYYTSVHGSEVGAIVDELIGVVATALGIYSLLRAQKLYTESRRNGGMPPALLHNAK